MTLKTIADGVFRIPTVEEGFIQQQEALDKQVFGPEKIRMERTSGFRIWLRHGGKFCDLTKPSIREALTAAFEQTGVKLPAIITELQQRLEYVKTAPVKESRNAEENAENKKDRQDTIDALEKSIRLIMPLADWLAEKPAETTNA